MRYKEEDKNKYLITHLIISSIKINNFINIYDE